MVRVIRSNVDFQIEFAPADGITLPIGGEAETSVRKALGFHPLPPAPKSWAAGQVRVVLGLALTQQEMTWRRPDSITKATSW